MDCIVFLSLLTENLLLFHGSTFTLNGEQGSRQREHDSRDIWLRSLVVIINLQQLSARGNYSFPENKIVNRNAPYFSESVPVWTRGGE